MARDYAAALRQMMAMANNDGASEKERATYLEKALAFAAKHGIDIAMLEAETTGNLVISRRFGFTRPFAKDKARLWSVVSHHFGCHSVVYSGNVYRTYGYASDLGLADTLFDLLWEHGCNELGMAVVPEYVSARSFSTAFWAAYQSTIHSRLKLSKEAAVAETTGAALVLVSRENAVNDEIAKNHGELRSVNTRRYVRSMSGWAAGTDAGERANLGHPIQN